MARCRNAGMAVPFHDFLADFDCILNLPQTIRVQYISNIREQFQTPFAKLDFQCVIGVKSLS
jgi:hypothetical protein